MIIRAWCKDSYPINNEVAVWKTIELDIREGSERTRTIKDLRERQLERDIIKHTERDEAVTKSGYIWIEYNWKKLIMIFFDLNPLNSYVLKAKPNKLKVAQHEY